ncbi:MAG: hypothetical protein M3Q72_06080, partial [Actinomycetota bacterium]|nr:hypothetical protein [Actinomycetota bacterium]
MSGDLRNLMPPPRSDGPGDPRASGLPRRARIGASGLALPSGRRPRYNGGTVLARRTFLVVSVAALLALACFGFEWEGRVGRLRRALESADAAERIDALRSLARHPA